MIVIIGAGALGSHAALALRNADDLKIVDFDKVEQKNTQSQFHTKMGLGRNKANGLAQSFQGLFGVSIEAVPHKLTSDNAAQVVGTPELLIDCTDNIEARNLIREHVSAHGIPCLHGAISADGSFAQIVWSEDFKPDAESGDGATCEDGENLPFIMAVGSTIAVEAQRFLKTGKKQSFQLIPGGITRIY